MNSYLDGVMARPFNTQSNENGFQELSNHEVVVNLTFRDSILLA